jgi:hypothetical protein
MWGREGRKSEVTDEAEKRVAQKIGSLLPLRANPASHEPRKPPLYLPFPG